MPQRSTSLGHLERVILDALWDHGPALSVRDVLGHVVPDRQLAYTTVMTVLDRLAKKGLATREREGRAWLYTAAVTREQLTAESLRTTWGELDGDRRGAMLHFLGDASPGELDDLKAALAEVEARRTTG